MTKSQNFQTAQNYDIPPGQTIEAPPAHCIGIARQRRTGHWYSGEVYRQLTGMGYVTSTATISYTVLKPGDDLNVYRSWQFGPFLYRLTYKVTNELSAAGITRLRVKLLLYSYGTLRRRYIIKSRRARVR